MLKSFSWFLSFQNPGVQSSASLALAVMSENLSSRDVVGKVGKSQLQSLPLYFLFLFIFIFIFVKKFP